MKSGPVRPQSRQLVMYWIVAAELHNSLGRRRSLWELKDRCPILRKLCSIYFWEMIMTIFAGAKTCDNIMRASCDHFLTTMHLPPSIITTSMKNHRHDENTNHNRKKMCIFQYNIYIYIIIYIYLLRLSKSMNYNCLVWNWGVVVLGGPCGFTVFRHLKPFSTHLYWIPLRILFAYFDIGWAEQEKDQWKVQVPNEKV